MFGLYKGAGVGETKFVRVSMGGIELSMDGFRYYFFIMKFSILCVMV